MRAVTMAARRARPRRKGRGARLADFGASLSRMRGRGAARHATAGRIEMTDSRWLAIVARALIAALWCRPDRRSPRPGRGPYARIAVLRPHDGRTVDFEAGYLRHLEFHRQAKDPWTWYGWTVWAGERQRWFVYATFGHSAAASTRRCRRPTTSATTSPTSRPHAEFAGNAVYGFLPALSRGTGTPSPTAARSS